MSNVMLRFLWIILLLTACQPTPVTSLPAPTQPAPTRATATLTPIPTFTPTPPPTAIPSPTTSPTPLPLLRHTPPTLMLHRSNASFDAVQFLREMIAILKESEMRVVTYREISAHPEITATEQGKLFIITIDDIYLRYPMDDSIKEMISILKEAGYPAVLAVITEYDYAYPETVQTLKELSEAGWEIASHTDGHRNLGEMEKSMPRTIYLELKTSLDKIEKATGYRPITLVLPEGQMVNDSKQLIRAGLTWAVGINGGAQYNLTRKIFYVGREGPDGDAAQTFKNMLARFSQ